MVSTFPFNNWTSKSKFAQCALLCFIHISIGFAKLLQTHFPKYEYKVLRYISELFLQKRVKRINFIAKEKKAEKAAENAAKKAEKAAQKKAKTNARKNVKKTVKKNTKKNVKKANENKIKKPVQEYSLRSATKIAQYRNN